MGTCWGRFVSDETVARRAEASKAVVGASWPFMQLGRVTCKAEEDRAVT
jgi:hypothetical protein